MFKIMHNKCNNNFRKNSVPPSSQNINFLCCGIPWERPISEVAKIQYIIFIVYPFMTLTDYLRLYLNVICSFKTKTIKSKNLELQNSKSAFLTTHSDSILYIHITTIFLHIFFLYYIRFNQIHGLIITTIHSCTQ